MKKDGAKILTVIPARGGSKGIKRKNVVEFLGKPLISWTIEASISSKKVNRTVVSTEDEEIKEIAIKCGAEVPFLRPYELARCGVHSVYALFHILEALNDKEGYKPDVVLMLLPTSPFRSSSQIDSAIDLFFSNECSGSVISVCEAKKQLIHFRKIVDGLLEPLIDTSNLNVQRQEAEPLYELNGSIYVSTPEYLRESSGFHGSKCFPFIMDWKSSIDINTPEDLMLAKLVYNSHMEF